MHSTPGRSPENAAFTRFELFATVAALALVAAAALPLLAVTARDTERFVCASNFRHLGRATFQWATEHGDRVPWRTPPSEGGTMSGLRLAVAWAEWGVMSNEIARPEVFACPADTGVRVARAFDGSPGGGFFNPGFRANALSYIVALHAATDYGNALLSSDRNIAQAGQVTCSTGVTGAEYLSPQAANTWTNAIHGLTGNVLTIDGRVEYLGATSFRELISSKQLSFNTHYLRAR